MLTDLCTPDVHRPIDLARAPDGSLLLLDFGAYEIHGDGRVISDTGSGALWRISKTRISTAHEIAEVA